MAKRKLSYLACQFIVDCRDDPSKTLTWDEISILLKEKFEVSVNLASVYKAYNRHKRKLAQGDNAVVSVPTPSEFSPPTKVVQLAVQPPVKSQPEPEIDRATLFLGTGIRKDESPNENNNIDLAAGASNEEINRLKEKFFTKHKRRSNEPIFKHNEPIDPEMLKLLNISN